MFVIAAVPLSVTPPKIGERLESIEAFFEAVLGTFEEIDSDGRRVSLTSLSA